MIADPRLESPTYLAASKGQPCAYSIPEVCNRDWSTTVPSHIRDDHTGGAIKASDCSIADSCDACHAVMDRRAKMPDGKLISDADWHVYALRGLQRTLESRIRRNIPFKHRQKRRQSAAMAKPKPKGVGRKIATRTFPDVPRPLKSHNNLRRSK